MNKNKTRISRIADNFGKRMALFDPLWLPLMLAAFLSLILVSPGCKTVSSGDNAGGTNLVSVPDVNAMATVAKSAAFLGTSIYLNGMGDGTKIPAHPQARAKFETVRDSIAALVAAGSFSAGDLSAALQALPIKELQGDQGTLIVGEAVILWDQYGRQLAALDKARVFEVYILPIARALLDGFDLALGPASPGKPGITP